MNRNYNNIIFAIPFAPIGKTKSNKHFPEEERNIERQSFKDFKCGLRLLNPTVYPAGDSPITYYNIPATQSDGGPLIRFKELNLTTEVNLVRGTDLTVAPEGKESS